MSFINIINESFDKQNKNILAGSNSKKLKEAAFTDTFNGHSDELDRFYDYMFEAAKDLGFQDFDVFDDGWTVTLTYIDSVGNKQQAEFDFDDELSFESKEDAIDCLMSLDWKVVDDEDLDESIKNKKKLGRKFQSLKEASNKLYKYLVINHFRPGDYYMIKSDKPATEIGDWIFTDVSDEHGNGYVIWSRSEIEFHPNQSPQELDKLVYDKLIEYMRDAEKRDRLIDLIYRRHLDARDLGFNDEIFYYPLSFDTEDLFNDYRIDKSLSKYRHLFSDVIEKSRAYRYSSGGIDYVNIDNLDNYADYYEFFKEDSEDEDKDENTTISSYLQDKLEKLKNLDHIPDFFFSDSSISSIVIPSNIKSIGDFAFINCFDLKSVTIPDSVKSIGDRAFCNCRGLKNITISNSVTDIAEYAFESCAGLKNIIIPDSITHIRNATFYYCDSLTNITLPGSIASIGTLSFAYCYELKEITYKGTKEDWNKIIKRKGWDYDSPIKTIHCTDGDIEIENKW